MSHANMTYLGLLCINPILPLLSLPHHSSAHFLLPRHQRPSYLTGRTAPPLDYTYELLATPRSARRKVQQTPPLPTRLDQR